MRDPKAKNCRRLVRCIEIEGLEQRVMLAASTVVMHPTFTLWHPKSGSKIVPFASSSATGVAPATMRQAYGVDLAQFGAISGDGTGQTIAIVDAYSEPTIVDDLAAFDANFGLAAPPSFTVINQSGQTSLPSSDVKGGWGLETALDVEWAHVIAPGANIVLVEANNSSSNNLYAAVDTARKLPGVNVVSMSWGGDELSTDSFNDTHFVTPAGHAGVTFVASSGDQGSYSQTKSTTQIVGYPAVSANVLGVGGTSLSTSGAVYSSESGWGNGTSSNTNGGSGGGISKYFSQPSFQSGVVTQSTTHRTVPDVAMDADPNTGVPIYSSYDNGSSTPWTQVGGTSLAAPMWSGVIAIADQGRALAGLGSLDGATQTLPMIYALPGGDFHDVISGNNGYQAGAGYDLVTGLGTPLVNKVVTDLVGVTRPIIGEFAIAAPVVIAGGTATLTASNVGESGGGTISGVNFYRESNGTTGLQIGADTMVGAGTFDGTNWTLDQSTGDLTAGIYTYYAVAVDGANVSGAAASAVLTVTSLSGSNFITGTVVAWNTRGQTSYGAQGLAATTVATGAVNSTGLTRGSGVSTASTASSNAWGGRGWDSTSADGIAGGDFVTFGFTVGAGYMTSLDSIGLNYRRNSSGPANGYWQYQVNNGDWNLIGDFTNEFSSSSSGGGTIAPISLAGIGVLQNLPAGSVVNFRVVPYGASSSTGTWYVYDGGLNRDDLVISASTVIPGTPSIAVLQANPAAVTIGDTVTLTASNVAEVGGAGAITGVNFYLESNNTTGLQSDADTLVGAGVQNGSTWTLTVSSADLPPGVYTYYAVASDGNGFQSAAVSVALTVSAPPAAVVARQLFFNDSTLDGNDPSASAADDNAIATGITALLPGESDVSGHVSGYSKGINGIMIDVSNLALPGALTTDDFEFRMGSSGDAASWDSAPLPSQLAVRQLAGGVERVTLIWADGAIVGNWLRVTMKADVQTGLTGDDVFYFGSLPGDSNGDGAVNFADLVAVAQNYGMTTSAGAAGGDFDGDGNVGFADLVTVAQGYGSGLTLPAGDTPLAVAAPAKSKPAGATVIPGSPFGRKNRITMKGRTGWI